MRTTFKLGLAAIIAVSVMLSSCGKYEDGPKISFATKKGRMVNTWKLVAVFEDGVQQPTISTEVRDIKKDGTFTETQGSSSYVGTWSFSSDKESVTFTENGGSYSITYKILRLKSKELWLEYMFTYSIYSYTLEYHYEKN